MTEELGLANKESIHVLHVDDEAGFLMVSKRCLEMEGNFQIDIALSVDEAMKKLKKKSYDAIVADYKMPGKDFVLALEFGFPYSQEFIENEAYCADREKKIEKILRIFLISSLMAQW